MQSVQRWRRDFIIHPFGCPDVFVERYRADFPLALDVSLADEQVFGDVRVAQLIAVRILALSVLVFDH